jgi:hypothetical protein
VALLHGCGLTNKAARTLLEGGGNREVYPQGQWIIRPIPGHRSGKALGVYPAGDENDVERSSVSVFPCQYTPTDQPPSYAGSALDVERSILFVASNSAVLNGADLSTQPRNSTLKGDTTPDKQPRGDSRVVGPFYAPTPSSAPPRERLVNTGASGPAQTPAEGCPTCRCTHLIVMGDYRKCALCSWVGKADALWRAPVPSPSTSPNPRASDEGVL